MKTRFIHVKKSFAVILLAVFFANFALPAFAADSRYQLEDIGEYSSGTPSYGYIAKPNDEGQWRLYKVVSGSLTPWGRYGRYKSGTKAEMYFKWGTDSLVEDYNGKIAVYYDSTKAISGSSEQHGVDSTITAYVNNHGAYYNGWGYNGGAIYNEGDHRNESINADFIGNYVSEAENVKGGAISNYNSDAKIGDITGDFIGNYVYAQFTIYGKTAVGGAIYNDYGSIKSITGDFIGNYALAENHSSGGEAKGGAIFNNGSWGGK